MDDNRKMKIATVYQVDYRTKTRLPVGSLVERRQTERGNNQKDLLRLARQRFASNPNDALNMYIVYFLIDKEADAAPSMRVRRTREEAVEVPAGRMGNG
jgi:hypothetical protein